MMKKLLLAGGLALAFLAAAGLWTWRTRYSAPPPLKREPLAESSQPQAPLTLELENFLPEGAQGVVGFPHLDATIAAFKRSALYSQFTVQLDAAKEKAAKALPIKVPQPAGADLSGWMASTFSRGFVAAGYPPKLEQEQPGQGLKTLAGQRVVILVRVPDDFTWSGSPFEALVNAGAEDVYRGVLLKKVGLLATVAEVPSKFGRLLIIGNDDGLVRRCIDLIAEEPGGLASEPWLQAAAKTVPADSFFYAFSKERALSLNKYTDWSSLGLSWSGGLHYRAYGQYAADMAPELRKMLEQGPADYPLLSWVPTDGPFFAAFNSLSLGPGLRMLQNALAVPTRMTPQAQAIRDKMNAFLTKDVLSLADAIGEQAAFGLPGFYKDAEGKTAFDFFAVLELRSPLRVRLGLSALDNIFGSQARGVSIKGAGPCYAAKSGYVCQKDRWLLIAGSEATMKDLVAHANAPAHAPPPFLTEHAAKSNLVGYLDVYALWKNIAGLAPGAKNEAWAALAKPISCFGRGTFIAVNQKDGATFWFDQPFKDLSAEEWAATLAPLQPMLDALELKQRRAKVIGLIAKDLVEMRVALYKYKAARRHYPRSLRLLVPRYLKRLPADPTTGFRRVAASRTGRGGWVYDRHTGRVLLNAAAEQAAPGQPMAAVTPQERGTLTNLVLLRRAVVLAMRAGPRRALPANLGQLVDMRILPALPQAMTGLHAPSSAATNYDRRDSAILHDTGGWGYVPATGTVFIDCTHKGPFGRFWYQF